MIFKKIFNIFIICTLLSFILSESAISSECYYVRIGKLTCIPNPCTYGTTTTCIPGLVWAIEYSILYFNGSWRWCDYELPWNGYIFKVGDLVIVIEKNGDVEDIMPICIPQVTISPGCTTLNAGETKQFSASTTCDETSLTVTYIWEILEQGCAGSSIDTNTGLYTASTDTSYCIDTIKVSVKSNEYISDTATVVVNHPFTTTVESTTTTTIPVSTTTTTDEIPCPPEKIYGEHSEEVNILRYFRDNVLSQTPEGQEIIKLYYQWSPMIVKMMEEDEEFREEVKEMIDGILPMISGEL